jgi:hydrogenase maturation factor
MLAKADVGGVRRNVNIGLVHHEEEQVDTRIEGQPAEGRGRAG